jgi:flagellar basal-body rod protein FlgB
MGPTRGAEHSDAAATDTCQNRLSVNATTGLAAGSAKARNSRSQGQDAHAPMLKWKAGKTMIDFDRDTAFAARMLDVLTARTKAATHNIANQNVPGFKRYVVRFEDMLRQAQADAQGSGQAVDETAIEPVTERDASGPPDQNNVILMDELSTLGKTSLLHDVMTRRVGSYFAGLNKAIFGR